MKDTELTTNGSLQQALMETQESLRLSLQDKQKLVAKLKKARRDYLSIFDSVPAMIWYRDKEGRILKVNQCAADSVGLSVRELLGKNYYDLFPDGAERSRQQDLEVMETGRPLHGQLRSFRAYNGLDRWVTVDRIALRDEDGRINGVMIFAVDITDKKRTEQELVAAKTDLEQANRHLKAAVEQARLLAEKATRSNRAKSEMLASSSHDLRTPMNSIIGFAEILMDTALSDEQKEYAKTIHSAAKGLLSLINDILDYSRIEAGKLKIEIGECGLADTLDEVADILENGARKKGLEFKIQIDQRLPEAFYTDSVRLKQCLINLVGNAVKFTDAGHVGIYVVPDEHAGQPCIRFDVEDTGIGIPQDKQEVIFKSFAQADASTAQKYGGSGLGLTITRRLAGLLGGEVRLKSDVGKGSTFSLILPLFVQSSVCDGPVELGARYVRRTRENTEAFTGRILLAEKAFPSQLTLTLMLRRFGLDVHLAGSLDQVRRCVKEQSFDLLLLDAAMGREEIASLVRQIHDKTPQTPVLLVADADFGQKEDCRQAGFADCLYRPLSRDQLFDAIAVYLPPKEHRVTAIEADAAGSVESVLERLPELASGIRDVLMQSDTELLTRFAELFCEIGQTTGQNQLSQTASEILQCAQNLPAAADALNARVAHLVCLCDQIHQAHAPSDPAEGAARPTNRKP